MKFREGDWFEFYLWPAPAPVWGLGLDWCGRWRRRNPITGEWDGWSSRWSNHNDETPWGLGTNYLLQQVHFGTFEPADDEARAWLAEQSILETR